MARPNQVHLSASSIAAFKACPTRFRLAYHEGIRPVEDTDAQRIGTNWHALHEVYRTAYRQAGAKGEKQAAVAGDSALRETIDYLNQRYADTPKPASKTLVEWDTERFMLLYSFIGYLWYWQDDTAEVLANELEFELPLHEPNTGLPLSISEVVRVGKVDQIVAWNGVVGPVEMKSTSKSIDADSDYWDRVRRDTQVSMYALALRDFPRNDLPEAVTSHPDYNPDTFGNTIYDAWRKPTTKPKKLSQKDTAAFLESKEYYGQSFEVEYDADPDHECFVINGDTAETEVGKSGKPAIRETPEMYGARLLADIQERPEHYFVRREIPRTNKNLAEFRAELYRIYQAQKAFVKQGCWFQNEAQCRATFHCKFIPICHGEGPEAVCDGETIPNGFRRLFTDLTLNGSELESE